MLSTARREREIMKKLLGMFIIILTVVSCLSISSHAQTVTAGMYTLEITGTTAKIKSVNFGNLDRPEFNNLTIDKKFGNYTITSIGSYAFTKCKYLKKVILPDTVTTLDEYAFAEIESVELSKSVKTIAEGAFSAPRGSAYKIVSSITVNSSNPYFVMGTDGALYNKNKTELVHYTGNATSFTVPSTVKKIRGYAFAWSNRDPYRELTSITLPFSVTDIGQFAFFNCRNLQSVNFPYGLKTVGDYAFAYTCIPSAYLPDTVTSVGEYAFSYVETLTAAYFPDWLTTISKGTFAGCKNLVDFTLPSALTKVDDYAFYNCNKLKDQPMPKSLIWVNWAAFRNCDQLTEAVFSDELMDLSSEAFYNCDKLEKVRLSAKIDILGECTFAKCPLLKEVIIPEGVTFINPSAFADCTSLESVELPDSMTLVNSTIFQNCTSLKNVKLPKNTKTLHAAFMGCTALTQITIPGTVTALSSGTFLNCSALKDVYFDNTKEVWETIRPNDDYWQDITVHFYQGMVSFVEDGKTVHSAKAYTQSSITAPEGSKKLGYEFLGWSLSEGGDVVYKAGEEISGILEDTVFYGVWKKSVYTETESLGNGHYMVSVVGAPLGSKVIFAAYNGERLVYKRAVDYANKDIPCFVDSEYDFIKVFLWEDFGTITPLCKPETPEL